MRQSHLHEEHEIILILHGSGKIHLEDTRILQVSAGQIGIVPGGQSHILEVDNHITLRGLYIHPDLCRELKRCGVNDSLLDRLSDYHHPLPACVVSDAHHFRSLQELFEQSQAEYPHNDPWKVACQRTIGRLAAITLVRLMQIGGRTPQADSTTLRVENVKAWIDRHFLEQIALQDLARMAHLSLSQFSSLFKNLYGISPKAYLIRCRLNRASDLLAETDLSITEIATELGFAHLAHFGRLFREHSGITPREYRKIHQKLPQKVLDSAQPEQVSYT
ncbi:MAG TPA: AraC family transcriptional regulator [Armatimonadota bacterium]|nr:AraC family transcriptional regulator [Armatimonadota bacterium]